MRATFIKTLTELAERDPRILLLTGDLGYLALDPFSKKIPDRFFNMGVAEQNMVGAASGLAEAGFIPFAYSIVTFASLRPYEFIRNGPVFQRLPVRIVGVGGGYEYGHNGPTHHGLEDIGAMRLLPGLTVVAPADFRQARTALTKTWDLPGPVYYRVGKNDTTEIRGLDGRFELGRAQTVGEGGDVLLVSMGSVADQASEGVEILKKRGLRCTLMIVASISPPPMNDLIEALSRFRLAVSIEAHYTVGGVGSLISEVVAENGLHCRVVRCGVHDVPDGVSGERIFLLERHGLTSTAIVETVLRELDAAARHGG